MESTSKSFYKVMASISSTLLLNSTSTSPLRYPKFSGSSPFSRSSRFGNRNLKPISIGLLSPGNRADGVMATAASVQGVVTEAMNLIQSASPTWKSAVANNLLIFVLGSPLLVTGLSASGIAAAFLLGTLTWRAYGSSGFLLVAADFVIDTDMMWLRSPFPRLSSNGSLDMQIRDGKVVRKDI